MIKGLDSSTMPTAAQARAAAAAGIRLWSGYLQTRANVGLYAPWTKAGFDCARLCGSTPIAFCSGWDDPVACKALAAAWGVRLCLDVEGGIRGDGPWVQGWLNASGAGLYGNAPVHNKIAPFHILAAYPGLDPKATWSGAGPGTPCGWQFQGTHTEFGVGVDRGWYDDWFQLGEDMTPAQEADLTETKNKVNEIWNLLRTGLHAPANPRWIFTELEAIKAKIATMPAGAPGADGKDGKDGIQGPPGTVPDHHHNIASTGPMVV